MVKKSIVSNNSSDEKSLLEALAQSEQSYRDLAEMLPQTVYELDLEGRITYMNKAGLLTFGHKHSAIGLSSLNSIAPEDRARMQENMRKSIADTDFTPGNEYTALRTDGTRFPIIVYASSIVKNGTVTGTRGIIVDISKRKAMENALRESELKYKTLVENSLDGIVIIQNNNILFSNDTICRMLGYTCDELYNMPSMNLVHPSDHDTVLKIRERRMNMDQSTVYEVLHLITKEGAVIECETSSTMIQYGEQWASFLTLHDITERKKNELELKETKEKLEKINLTLEKKIKETATRLTKAKTQLINLQKENLQSQFDVLRQQVNPHFLFNSLNVLTSLIKLEPDLAEKFSEQLSKVYRYVLENKDNELIDLHTELSFLDAYIFLINIRFVDKVIVRIDIPDERRGDQLIPLAMQLLIENAIKHNRMSKANPLKIEISIDKDNFLVITNNLQERPSHLTSTGVGLKNIQKRYFLLNRSRPVFEKTDSQFIARVPLIKREL